MALEELQQLIAKNAGDKGALLGLDERMATANALRNSTPSMQRDTGYVDPMSAIASLFEAQQGRDQAAEYRPMQEAARGRILDTAAAKENYGLRLAADKVSRDQGNVENLANARVKAATVANTRGQESALTLAMAKKLQDDQTQSNWSNKFGQENTKNALAQDNLESKGTVVHLQNNNDPTQRARGISDREGNVTIDGQPAGSEWTEVPQPKGESGQTTSGNSYPKIPFAEQDKRDSYTRTAKSMNNLNLEFMPEFGNTSGLPLAGQIENAIASRAPVFSNPKSKERQAWWSKFQREYELAARHELFGSALSGTEAPKWLEANIREDMDGGQIAKKLAELQYMMQEEQAARGESAAVTGQYPPKYIKLHYGPAMEATAKREARETAVLDSLSDDDRKEYRGYSLFMKNQLLDAVEAEQRAK